MLCTTAAAFAQTDSIPVPADSIYKVTPAVRSNASLAKEVAHPKGKHGTKYVAPSGQSPKLAKEALKDGNLWREMKEHHVFDKLDVAFTLGTTGLGLELSSPMTNWARLRVGFDGIPGFNLPMRFDVATYAGEENTNGFEHVKDIMYQITGQEIDETVRMNAKLHFYNFKLLVDVFPFQNDRRWHFTAGLYFGSSLIGTAVNAKAETNSLVAMNLYNRIYDKMVASDGQDPLFGDIYISHETYERMMQYGRVGVHMGDFKDGTPYYMTPEANGTVSARAKANSVKPYLGAGFSSPVDRSGRLSLGVDAGVLFWGGSPDVILADGVNMTKELHNIPGKVGSYVGFMKAMKVYPAVTFKISYTFF